MLLPFRPKSNTADPGRANAERPPAEVERSGAPMLLKRRWAVVRGIGFGMVLAGAALAPGWVPSASAAPALVAQELVLAERPVLLTLGKWQGKPGVWVITEPDPLPDHRPMPSRPLYLLRFEPSGPRIESRWDLPNETRWVEPVTLPGGVQRLLALIGARWYLGRPEGSRWEWAPLCGCRSVFSDGKALLPQGVRFARDLDGDGVDELLLPDWHGLVAYRFSAGGDSPVPLWRIYWEIPQKLDLAEELRVAAELPRYLLVDADGDGVPDYVEIGESGLRIAYVPKAQPNSTPASYFLDGAKRAQLRNKGIPASLSARLESVGTRAFATPPELAEAIGANHGGKDELEWKPHWAALLAIAREPFAVLVPGDVSLPGLLPKRSGEKHRVLAVADMDGNGTLDVLHVTSNAESEIFNQKNRLQWYSGRLADHRLVFDEKPQLLFTEGPTFAELVYLEKSPDRRPALFVATLEVTLMAFIRALTMKTVNLDVFLYRWSPQHLTMPAGTQASLTFGVDFRTQKRPMVLLADLDGDGRREVLFNLRPDQVSAFRAGDGVSNWDGAPFATGKLELPRKPEWVTVADLYGDGREELLLWYRDGGDPPLLRRTLRVVRMVDVPER
jgi:hypothetical protein